MFLIPDNPVPFPIVDTALVGFLRAGTRYRSAERNLGPERRLGCGSRLRAKPEPRNINFIYLHGRGKDVAGPAEPGQLWRRVEWGGGWVPPLACCSTTGTNCA